jgi:formylglycine-generating enzyme required for sulfatase activity
MFMKVLRVTLLLVTFCSCGASAEEARFFRISGPVATTITAFSADGYVTWTNAPTNAIFTVQVAQSLTDPPNWVDYVQVPVTSPATTHRLYDPNPPTNMALIPAGSFTMGDTFSEASVGLPLHTVYVSAFYMDRYEVTKALWDDVWQWAISHSYSFEHGAAGKVTNHPAQSMTWYDAVKWCNARSEKEQRTPAYYTDAGLMTVYRSGETNVQNDWVKWNMGYRLPTEAEWEKAARGGAGGHRFPWSDADTISHSRANYNAWNNYSYDLSCPAGYHPTFAVGDSPYTSPVGYFAPNGYELYDMSGNVWEWCWDWYGLYSSDSQSDPRGPPSGSGRRFRGGSWVSSATYCTTTARYNGYTPSEGDGAIGFRAVLPAGQ